MNPHLQIFALVDKASSTVCPHFVLISSTVGLPRTSSTNYCFVDESTSTAFFFVSTCLHFTWLYRALIPTKNNDQTDEIMTKKIILKQSVSLILKENKLKSVKNKTNHINYLSLNREKSNDWIMIHVIN